MATASKSKTLSKTSEPALISKLTVKSNKNKDTVSIANGTIQLQYWESILQDSIRASVVFTDTGNSLPKKRTLFGSSGKGKVGVVEGLPIIGEEQVILKFEDNLGNVLEFSDNDENSLFVNKIKSIPTQGETTNKAYELKLASKEFLDNEEGWSRVRTCYSGQVSDHVRSILEKNLKTKKDLDIEETKKTLDFTGHNKKPFFTLNTLAQKAVSSKIEGEGTTAGYFFWETANGFHFKSIDTLLSGKQKLSILYNENADSKPPAGYDVKALSLEMDNRIDVKRKKMMGAYSTRSILFNPRDGYYFCDLSDALSEEGKKKVDNEELKCAGEELPTLNNVFKDTKADTDFTRTTWNAITTGQLNYGPISDQLDKAKEINFDYSKVLNQSISRYNQLFASQITIVIPGNFSLHAGDTVFMDIPESGTTQNKACSDEVNQQDGGVYLITDLCHYVTAKETYTKLVLTRDSFGRVGSPTKGRTDGNELSGNAKKIMEGGFLTNIK